MKAIFVSFVDQEKRKDGAIEQEWFMSAAIERHVSRQRES
jgi:hypothetical protein